jgi:hypothetical protein
MVKFLIIVSQLIAGGAINYEDYEPIISPIHCFGPNGCPNDDQACLEFCKKRRIPFGGCNGDSCCCGK